MKKSLIALLIGLCSCSQTPKCPTDDELLKAGFRILSASEIMESEKQNLYLARTMYQFPSQYFFECGRDNPEHMQKHYEQAQAKVVSYLYLTQDQKIKIDRNLRRIRKELDHASLTRK